ncbi:Ger(x)C family spore germination protein [Neobacillus sp. OS1-33]|jgi:spore germination protein KC|uniref:Ger(x)C family spore germination protein n=1 Tax=Neobacillus sp. OS1-33 TaxID=3070683 RepID=UPI0027E1B1EE|nr:Ger(x)C family spore germination protein [Neobacillus sp. OS1-33]WML27009.1 Ger(x)C family spore germination protein [Neobacillus sp. OS1-33]
MKKLVKVILVMGLSVPILTACWNQKELTDLAFVMALGIDKGEDDLYHVSFQLVNPGNVSAGQGGGGQGLPIAVYKSTGRTMTEAARNATKEVSRRLYYAHTNVVVVSEELAKDRTQFLNLLDSFARDPEFRTTTEILVARDASAEEIVTTLTILDKLPVSKITKEIKSTEAMKGENFSISIDDLIDGIVGSGKEPVLNGYQLIGMKEEANKAENLQKTTTDAFLTADGLAVIKDGALIDWIESKKSRGVLWVLDKAKSTDITLKWKGKKNALSIVPIRSKTKVSTIFKQGKPVINIKIENEGWLSEANTAIDLMDPKTIGKIEKLTEKAIKKEVQISVKEAKRLKCDIFGFGDVVHKANPDLWKKLERDWNNYFSDLEVNVKVDSYLRREGVRTNPFWSDINK